MTYIDGDKDSNFAKRIINFFARLPLWNDLQLKGNNLVVSYRISSGVLYYRDVIEHS